MPLKKKRTAPQRALLMDINLTPPRGDFLATLTHKPVRSKIQRLHILDRISTESHGERLSHGAGFFCKSSEYT